jgi:hypothetical protein
MTSWVKTWRLENGFMIHDGDCRFFDVSVCTCGLIHHQMPRLSSMTVAEREKHWNDRMRQQEVLDSLEGV